MYIYIGLFLTSLSLLSIEVSLVRLLSVTTWYHLSFFAISTAMLGMTAGATHIYLRKDLFKDKSLEQVISGFALRLVLSIPVTLVLLCLIPLGIFQSIMTIFTIVISTMACALPFYYGGMIVSTILTQYNLPMGKLYSSDLLGASLGCLLVLFGMEFLDTPSVLILCSAFAALAGLCFVSMTKLRTYRITFVVLFLLFTAAGLLNSRTTLGIRPIIEKGISVQVAPYPIERWNSFSRIGVTSRRHEPPDYWGGSPVAPHDTVDYHFMNIDGCAGTVLTKFESTKDIEHLRYDVTNIGYQLPRPGNACVIGVGGGRDVLSALLFKHQHVTGVEINPIFIDLLNHEYKDFAALGNRSDVTLVKAEARSYLSHSTEHFSTIQMSLIDTWASTGAGAFTLSENSLYTIEAWTIFLNRLEKNGIFTVSRWHSHEYVGETGRVIALAVGTLLKLGVQNPSDHIMLITSDHISTLLISPQPFSADDIQLMKQLCDTYQFQATILPGQPSLEPSLASILAAKNYDELIYSTSKTTFNYTPTTDENPYFFNMLRLSSLGQALKMTASSRRQGVIKGNLVATVTLFLLLFVLFIFAIVTVVLPLWFRKKDMDLPPISSKTMWAGGLYFSLIGAGFMLTEIALIQRLTVLLTHPIYALGILLFTVIASTGIGSFLSDRLPLTKRPWLYIYPIVTVFGLIAIRFILSSALQSMESSDLATKILVSVSIIFPLGILLGLFFPTGMRLAKLACPYETPWFWALNGIIGVLCSVAAVIISIYISISTNFYVAAACYLLALYPLIKLWQQAKSPETAKS